MEQHEVFSTNKYTDPIQQRVINAQDLAAQKWCISHHQQVIKTQVYKLLHSRRDCLLDQIKTRFNIYIFCCTTRYSCNHLSFFLVPYLSYHCLRNKQNLGIIKTSQNTSTSDPFSISSPFFTPTLPRNKPTCHILPNTTIGLVLTPFQRSLGWSSWTCSRLGVLATYTVTLPQKQKGGNFASNICRLNKLSLKAISTICSLVKFR